MLSWTTSAMVCLPSMRLDSGPRTINLAPSELLNLQPQAYQQGGIKPDRMTPYPGPLRGVDVGQGSKIGSSWPTCHVADVYRCMVASAMQKSFLTQNLTCFARAPSSLAFPVF
jgi:hypothetical protein